MVLVSQDNLIIIGHGNTKSSGKESNWEDVKFYPIENEGNFLYNQ